MNDTSSIEGISEPRPQFPMRINKYLAMEGRGSRREMDAVIAEGKVFINGAQAVLGSKVVEGDKVEIRFRGGKQNGGQGRGGQR